MRVRASHIWLALMFSTGFCSMIYELALAQLLGGLLGNALARFATTLGVYVVGLGAGSVLFKPSEEVREGRVFVRAEIGLFALGFLSPVLFTGSYVLAFRLFAEPTTRNFAVLIATHFIVFLTGFLSGFELPALSALSERRRAGSSSSVLAADYAGMFFGSVLFPIFLFPILGLIAAFWAATFLNLIAAVVALSLIGGRRPALIGMFGLGCLNLIGLIYSTQFQTWLAHLYVTQG